jgi:hypothetical protein
MRSSSPMTVFRRAVTVCSMAKARFDVYGRYQLQIERHEDRWVTFVLGEGKRREHPSIFIPSDIAEKELAAYLDDLLHEEGGGARTIRQIN